MKIRDNKSCDRRKLRKIKNARGRGISEEMNDMKDMQEVSEWHPRRKLNSRPEDEKWASVWQPHTTSQTTHTVRNGKMSLGDAADSFLLFSPFRVEWINKPRLQRHVQKNHFRFTTLRFPSGRAPVRSILEHLLTQKSSKRKTSLTAESHLRYLFLKLTNEAL